MEFVAKRIVHAYFHFDLIYIDGLGISPFAINIRVDLFITLTHEKNTNRYGYREFGL